MCGFRSSWPRPSLPTGFQNVIRCLDVRKTNLFFFLKNIFTENEGILYSNIKRSWGYPSEPPKAILKASLHPKKVLVSIWWDWQDVLYFELPHPKFNDWLRCLLRSIKKTQAGCEGKIFEFGKSEGGRLVIWQRQATHIFEDAEKIIGTKLGHFTTYTVFSFVLTIYSKDCKCLLILLSTRLNQLAPSTDSLGGCCFYE